MLAWRLQPGTYLSPAIFEASDTVFMGVGDPPADEHGWTRMENHKLAVRYRRSSALISGPKSSCFSHTDHGRMFREGAAHPERGGAYAPL